MPRARGLHVFDRETTWSRNAPNHAFGTYSTKPRAWGNCGCENASWLQRMPRVRAIAWLCSSQTVDAWRKCVNHFHIFLRDWLRISVTRNDAWPLSINTPPSCHFYISSQLRSTLPLQNDEVGYYVPSYLSTFTQ